jgi:hypothetical protein
MSEWSDSAKAADTMPADLATIKDTLKIHARRFESIETAIRENTAMTADIRDGMVMVRTFRRIIVWATPIVAAGWAFWHYVLEAAKGRP